MIAEAEILEALPGAELKTEDISDLEALRLHLHNPDNLNDLAGVLIPDVMVYPFPPEYLTIFKFMLQALVERNYGEIARIAIGIPRGFCKTTFLKVFVVYCVLYGYLNFVLIVSSTEKRAEDFLFDVDNVLSSDNVAKIWGQSWKGSLARDRQDSKLGRFLGRIVALYSIGALTAVRGLNIGNNRPQLILLDDAQSQENDASDAERNRLEKWVFGSLFKAIDNKGGMICYLGNMYSETCLLYKFSQSKHWHSLITGCILESSESLWEQLKPLHVLVEGYQHDVSMNKGADWLAEMMNMPVSETRGLLTEIPLPELTYGTEDFPWEGGFITVDLAGEKSRTSTREPDDNVIMTHMMLERTPYVHNIEAGKFSPKQVIQHICAQILTHRIRVVGIESIAYQATLAFWLRLALEKLNLLEQVLIVPIYHGHQSKQVRIKNWCQAIQEGAYRISNPVVRSIILWQALQYDTRDKEPRDDILDAGAMGLKLLSTHWKDIMDLISPHELQQQEPGRVLTASPITRRPRSLH